MIFHVTGIDVVGYPVTDTKRAMTFYRDVLDLEPTTTYQDGTGCEYEFADGTTFELYNAGPGVPFRPASGAMFGVSDWNAALANAKAAGVTIRKENETPVCFMAFIEDSEGNEFVIHRRKDALP